MQMFQIISWTSAFPPKLGPAMCGVIRTFSIFQRGDVSGNGSVSNTSRTAPFKWPSSSTLIRSSVGMRLPLPTLTRIASFSWNTAVRNSEGLLFPVFPGDSRSQCPLSEAADPALSDHIPHQTLSSAANAPGLQFFLFQSHAFQTLSFYGQYFFLYPRFPG